MFEAFWNTWGKSVFIPAAVSFLISYLMIRYKMSAEREAKRKTVLNAISAEVSCLLDLIKDRAKGIENIAEENKALVTLPLFQNYFTVYEMNAADLSVLGSNKLVMNIIKTYMETKGLFDDVKGFSSRSMEFIKIIGHNKGILEAENMKFMYGQQRYFDMIVNVRLPVVTKLLENLSMELQEELKLVD